MSIEADIVAALGAASAVTALVGSRVYLQEAPQDATLPFVAFEVVSSVPVEAGEALSNSPEQEREINETVIDVASHAATLTAAKSLADAVRDVFIRDLDAAVIENTQDQRDRDTRRKTVVQTYRIWHVEDFP